MNRVRHHAPQVAGIALALFGGIIWRSEPGSIEIKQHDGDLANVLWARIGSNRYAFAYNHRSGNIEIRERTQSGSPIRAFNDESSVSDVEAFFRTL